MAMRLYQRLAHKKERKGQIQPTSEFVNWTQWKPTTDRNESNHVEKKWIDWFLYNTRSHWNELTGSYTTQGLTEMNWLVSIQHKLSLKWIDWFLYNTSSHWNELTASYKTQAVTEMNFQTDYKT